jgi:hypothetical protein
MVKRDFGKQPLTVDEIINCYWYPVVDDTIGGWAMSNVDQSVAHLDPYEGQFELASFLTEEEARHIAQVHNKWYQDKVYKTYYDNVDEGLKLAMMYEAMQELDADLNGW